MAIPIYLIPVAVLVAVIVLFALGTRGRGRIIQCPECGEKFKRPAFAEKASGLGLSLPGIGYFTCPKCKYRASTTSFAYDAGK